MNISWAPDQGIGVIMNNELLNDEFSNERHWIFANISRIPKCASNFRSWLELVCNEGEHPISLE